MKLSIFQEPELEFGNGGTHVDIRYGTIRYGPLDLGEASAPTQLRVGLIGTDETISEVREWFERCRNGVAAKPSRLKNLFPEFPGFSDASPFYSSLIFHDRWCAAIRQREFDDAMARDEGRQAVRQAAAVFIDHAAALIEQGGPMVLVCAPPRELLAALDDPRRRRTDQLDQELDEGSEKPEARSTLAFHDVLKAEGLRLMIPIQMIRPSTYTDEGKPRKSGTKQTGARPLQDEATRA
ncbi:MAG TPA: hypothetical protein VGD60_07250, partial [Candidatus Acidoferrales bacterium]